MDMLLGRKEVRSIQSIFLGYVIRVKRGHIWLTLTQSQDHQDYLIKPPDKFILGRGEAAVIEAIRDSDITIMSIGRDAEQTRYNQRRAYYESRKL